MQVLSEQALMDCSWGFGNNACDGGEEWRAYEWIMKHGGIAPTETYGPYLGMVSSSLLPIDIVLLPHTHTIESVASGMISELAFSLSLYCVIFGCHALSNCIPHV